MIPGGRPQLMPGIVSGHAVKTSRPVVDGIYTGVPKGKAKEIGETHKVIPSATKHAVGQFGGLSAPEGAGRVGRR
jgi:hypothetical protein